MKYAHMPFGALVKLGLNPSTTSYESSESLVQSLRVLGSLSYVSLSPAPTSTWALLVLLKSRQFISLPPNTPITSVCCEYKNFNNRSHIIWSPFIFSSNTLQFKEDVLGL